MVRSCPQQRFQASLAILVGSRNGKRIDHLVTYPADYLLPVPAAAIQVGDQGGRRLHAGGPQELIVRMAAGHHSADRVPDRPAGGGHVVVHRHVGHVQDLGAARFAARAPFARKIA
jgi:hypothetical protein